MDRLKRIGSLPVALACGFAFATCVAALPQANAAPIDVPRAAISAASLIDAVEYYYAGLDHYFVTAAPGEIAQLDAGPLPGWQRTNLSFKVFDPAAKVAGVSPVCRFYGKPEAGLNSHFYSASPAECAAVRTRFGDSWLAETDNAFGVWLPDPQSGQCPAMSTPVYRSWNTRSDSNHRLTTDPVVHRSMIARGYMAEGYGPVAMPVAMCAPLDPANVTAPVCVALASESAPALGTQVVLTAYCSNAPDRYTWNGCSSSGATCGTTSTTTAPTTYAVTASNVAGASAPATVIVAWGSTPGDWAQRSAGRLFARRLVSADASDANLAGRHPSADVGVWTPDTPTNDTYEEPVIDSLGLRFDIKQGRGIPDWYFRLPREFGANSSFRMQWQQRFNQAFISTVFRTSGGSYPGIKLAIVSAFEASSPWEKLVVSTMDQHKFPFLYRYDQNGNTSNIQPNIGNPPVDFDWQPKLGQAPTCLYTKTGATPQGQAVAGCETLVADQWITFDLEADTGNPIPNTNTWDCEMRLYMTVNGVRKLVIRYGPGTPGYTGRNARPWTGVWLAPYMTDRDGSQSFPVTPSAWYREVIVDDKTITATGVPPVASTSSTSSSPEIPPAPAPVVAVFTPQRDASGTVTNYGTLPLYTWREIADTRMVSLLSNLPQSNAGDMNNVMANWGSSANDPATGDMHLHGGAHGANGENNGWYTFNTRRANWRITVSPVYMGQAEKAYLDKAAKLYYPGNPNAAYSGSWNIGMPPDFMFLPIPGSVRGDPTLDNPNAESSGKVYAHHAWNKLVWIEWMQRAYVSLIHMYFLDPVTGNVTLGQKHNDTDWQYNTADPVTKRVYGLTRAFSYNDYWDFREYDPVADRIIADYPIGLAPAQKYYFSANDARCIVGREIVFFNGIERTWFAFNMDNKTWRILPWQALSSVPGAGDFSMVYVPPLGKIVATQGWGELFQIDPATGEVSAFPVQESARFGSSTNNGLFGRLNYQDGMLFAIDWATSNVKVMRMQ